ncbi:hypothetical protein XELAEV_18006206mg [Xenopus laevis]|uniref:Uncharacterized protein n=1 Tax=Xenopus laevis TaxID=8355 RepID=A0A974I3Z8_XENLA|nr:hypothetical protein XELAEV_18006206mg [Xenopus laevis]
MGGTHRRDTPTLVPPYAHALMYAPSAGVLLSASVTWRRQDGTTGPNYLKPVAEEERKVEAEEKRLREEAERIAKELAAANEDTILK